MSTTFPKFENDAQWSVRSVAPTVIACVTRAGDWVDASTHFGGRGWTVKRTPTGFATAGRIAEPDGRSPTGTKGRIRRAVEHWGES
jgi:hypothetical protein